MKTNETPPNATIIEILKRRRGYISSTEVMEILGCVRQTLCRWVNNGTIPAIRIGKDNKFDPVHLVRWLEDRQLGV